MSKIIFSIFFMFTFMMASTGFSQVEPAETTTNQPPEPNNCNDTNCKTLESKPISPTGMTYDDVMKAGFSSKPKDKTEAALNDHDTKACRNCKVPTKGRITSNKGVYNKNTPPDKVESNKSAKEAK